MDNLVIPTVGSKGYFRLKAPFDSLMIENQQYTCQAVRVIGDFIANNEDPLESIYLDVGLTEGDYKQDLADTMYIVSLQAETGQWLYVPARYILGYPITNGVAYHTLMIGINIGAVPVDSDLTAIKTQLSNVIYDGLGVRPEIKEVQLSKVTLVDRDYHDSVVAARRSRATQQLSDAARAQVAQTELANALIKLTALENYIKSHYVETPTP